MIPGVGDLAKGSRLGKSAIKTVDAVADVTDGLNDARKAIKRTDALVDAGEAAKNVGNGAEAFADSSKAAKTLNKGSDALDTANDAGKALKNTDEVGGILNNVNPLENMTYTEKVQNQISTQDYHSFPKSVEAFGMDGEITEIIGGDGIKRIKINVKGGYRKKTVHLNLLLNLMEA